ncbi:aspartate--tRNA ligase [Oscillospiraceae bacterium PP1C4]
MDTMQGLKRTKYCGQFTPEDIGKEVVACGWVQKTRDLGNLVFIDLRDRSGILQLAFDDATPRDAHEKAGAARAEFVLMAKGIIRRRESVNKEIATGEIELYVSDLRILAKSHTPPFEITDHTNVKEELRLKYRYLDLRRGEMQKALMMRHKIVKLARDYYDENGFVEVETPILIKSTPEGARDYLVPSRVHPGSFFALPQSPQLYKQLLMLSGYDRYMQVARCFRDEDLRADRQPEFTQIDIEMSFVDEEDVMTINEGFMVKAFKEGLGIDVKAPFPRMPYKEAMDRFGSDKPDTRFGMELTDLSDILKNCEFKVFQGALETGSIRAINAKGAASQLTRKEIDKLVDFVKTYQAKGLAFTRLTEDGESSSFEKFLTEDEMHAIRERMGAETGDVILVVADGNSQTVYDSLGALRCELAKRLGLIQKGTFNFLWVTKFPLFEYSEEDGRYAAKHHPFTHPAMEDLDKLESDPGACNARAYDMVLNGCEVGGGSIRINDLELQQRMFKALGFDEATAYERFGFLLDAFKYGAPPHGGMAYGLDRLVMLMLEKDSIRDVIAFPKVQNASELMTQCPAEVDEKSLRELSIKIDIAQKE